MKHIKTTRLKVIDEDNAIDFEQSVNDSMEELGNFKPQLIIEHNKLFLAYIQYTHEEFIAETLAESFQLKGFRYKCEDCPHAEKFINRDGSEDGRKKFKRFCKKNDREVLLKYDACDEFYQHVFLNIYNRTDGARLLEEAMKMIAE